MRFYKLFMGFLVLFFSISCSESETKSSDFFESPSVNKTLDLVKIDEWMLTNDLPESEDSKMSIGRLRFEFVTNADHTLHAFYDELNKQILISDHQGHIKQVISGKGRGPGEILDVLGYHFSDENKLVLYDGGQLMLKVFDLDTEDFIETEVDRTEYLIGNRHLFPYNGYIYSPIIDITLQGTDLREAWKSNLIGVYNYDGDLVSTFGKYDPFLQEPKSYIVYPIIKLDAQHGRILSSHPDRFSLQVYDIETGKRLAWFGRQTEHFKQSEEFISPYASQQTIRNQSVGLSWTTGLYATSDYLINHFAVLTEAFQHTRNHNSKDHFLAIYNQKTYASYGEISIPYAVGNVADDTFYLIEDDNPDNFTIGVYELQEKD